MDGRPKRIKKLRLLAFAFTLNRLRVDARTDDESFSNVRALADASSCKAANKSTI